MKNKASNFVVFDIGSSKISALAAQTNKQGNTHIIAQTVQYSEGFQSGNITHMEMAENSIINAVYALEQELDKSIKEVTISLSGTNVKSYYIKQKIALGSQPISNQDIKRLTNKALTEFRIKDQEIIHYFPIEFIVDSNQVVDNPVGMYARELSCNFHIISADNLMIKNLTKSFAKCQIEVNDIILSIYASGTSCLTQDEKDLGAIILDIGSHTASFGLFLNNKIIYSGYVQIGGSHITTEIAKTLSIGRIAADKLKILYGNAKPDLLTKDNSITLGIVETNDINNTDLSVNTKHLSEIIHGKIREILLQIKKQCDNISMDHLLSNRIVITGGCAALPGLKNLAAEIFQKQIRIAKPEIFDGFSEDYNPYIYATVLGMVKLKSLKYNNHNHGTNWFNKMFSWFHKSA